MAILLFTSAVVAGACAGGADAPRADAPGGGGSQDVSSSTTGAGGAPSGASSTSTSAGGAAGAGGSVDPGAACDSAIDITSAVANGGMYQGKATATSSAESTCSAQVAPTSYLRLTLPSAGNYEISVSTTAGASDPTAPDAALFVDRLCGEPGSELVCNGTAAFLDTFVGLDQAGDVFIVLEGAWFATGYQLQVTPKSPCVDDIDCDVYSPQTMCDKGVCVSPYACPAGYDDCDGNAANACETNVGQDSANCGACGNNCSAAPHVMSAACDYGICSIDCAAGWGDCDGFSDTGCEVSTDTDVHNCGGCLFDCTKMDHVLSASCAAAVCAFSCAAGWADCDGGGLDGCETFVANDPNHCGGCAMDCNGGGCENGACTAPPTTLVSGLTSPFGIAVDASYVYWSDTATGTIGKVPIGGGTPAVVASGIHQPTYVAVSGGYVYYANEAYDATGGIYRVPVGGGTPSPVGLGYANINGFALSGGYAFFKATLGPENGLRRVALDGSGSTELLVLDDFDFPGDVAADGSYVYFTDAAALMVKRVPIAGGPVQTVNPDAGAEPEGIAVDASNAYWVNRNEYSNGIWKTPIGGGAKIELSQMEPATFDAGPGDVAVSGGFMFYTNDAAGWVRKVPTAGGPATTIAGSQNGPTQITVDGTHVYWTNAGGTIMRAPK